MKIVVSIEQRFHQTPDGSVWTQANYGNSFWQRYRAVFDQVRVIARIRAVESVPLDWSRADGPGISFAPLPYFMGPWQYAVNVLRIRNAALAAIESIDAVIMRIPSAIATFIEPALRQVGHPYGVEVVGDPCEVFAPGAIKTPLRPLLRWWFTYQVSQQCAHACAGSYVTAHALQQRYPLTRGAFATNYSSIELTEECYVSASRPLIQPHRRIHLIILASLAHRQKGVDILLEALAICLQKGVDLSLVVAGDGKHRRELERQTATLGLGERVHFLGQLTSPKAVRAELDQADVFVLPSRQEGLPRSMIEAMARALPCIGSIVGGIPELLPAEDLVAPNDPVALAQKICEVTSDPARMVQASARNLAKARQYHDDILCERRTRLLCAVKESTQLWIQNPR